MPKPNSSLVHNRLHSCKHYLRTLKWLGLVLFALAICITLLRHLQFLFEILVHVTLLAGIINCGKLDQEHVVYQSHRHQCRTILAQLFGRLEQVWILLLERLLHELCLLHALDPLPNVDTAMCGQVAGLIGFNGVIILAISYL